MEKNYKHPIQKIKAAVLLQLKGKGATLSRAGTVSHSNKQSGKAAAVPPNLEGVVNSSTRGRVLCCPHAWEEEEAALLQEF